ncbi:MAG TPA: hypothetical protein VM778_08890 [Gemmatimonadota bacterium]|nr:hypothetical protein [Gemmatimonadota bacterium]
MSANPNRRSILLGVLAATMLAAVALPVLRREPAPETARCPAAVGGDTHLAAVLLWNSPEFPLLASAASDGAPHPEDLRPLEGEADAEACGRILAAIPDSLQPLGILAPFHAAFYQAGGLYVAPVLPRVTQAEIEAESRGEWVEHKTGLTFVFGPDLELLAAIEN